MQKKSHDWGAIRLFSFLAVVPLSLSVPWGVMSERRQNPKAIVG